jgi:hypothetical protein
LLIELNLLYWLFLKNLHQHHLFSVSLLLLLHLTPRNVCMNRYTINQIIPTCGLTKGIACKMQLLLGKFFALSKFHST